MNKVEIYDTTLRDGIQADGVSFSVDDKLLIARALDNLGVSYIEGGYAGAGPPEIEFFQRSQKELFLNKAKLVAFGSTAKNNVKQSKGLEFLLSAETPVVAIVGKSWLDQTKTDLRISGQENLKIIENSINFASKHGREVFFDAEHFFDGYKESPFYAIETLKAAVNGGASFLVLCDTRGGAMTWEIEEIFEKVLFWEEENRINVPLGIHAHNDGGVAVANSLVAVKAGAVQLQGTFNGYGERCGNADLCALIPNLQIKMGITCVDGDNLYRLTELSRLISELANLPHGQYNPYVGRSAFTHKAGLHAAAVQKDPNSYEHISPDLVGNERRILVSGQSGRSTIKQKIISSYPELASQSSIVENILKHVKGNESEGYTYEDAEASFELLVAREIGEFEESLELLGFTVLVQHNGNGGISSQATIKLKDSAGNVEYQASEGRGPVDALDKALRKALLVLFPQLSSVQLVDFKVRILGPVSGAASAVKVSIESTDGVKNWNTVGVSEDIIEASWEALVDSIEYWLWQEKEKK